MSKIFKFMRIDEWFDSKVAMMLGVFMFFYIQAPQYSTSEFIIRYICYFLFIVMFLSFSYVINDYSDIEVDKKAGKSKIIATMPKWFVIVIMILMVLIGVVPILLLTNCNLFAIGMIISIYFLGAAYSIRPFRFKEKGLVGMLECSFAQRSLPLLIIPFLIGVDYAGMFFWLILSFADGVRYIFIHQVIDRENDLKSGVKTYVSEGNAFKKIVIVTFIVEILSTILFFVPYIIKHPISWLFVALYLFFEYAIYVVLQIYAKKEWLFTFDSVPLEALYNIFLPVCFSLIIASKDMLGCIVVLLIFVHIFKALKIKCGIVAVYLKSKFCK